MRLFRKPILQLSYRDRTLRFTPQGFRFFLLTLGVGIAALNTGNNLLYMVLAMMLSLIVVSGILSEQSVKKIAVSRALPRTIHAQAPFWIDLRVTNLKKFFPSFSLMVEDVADGRVTVGSHYVLKIPARQTVIVGYRGRFSTRGHHVFTGFRLVTRYPFGLFIKTRDIRFEREILVYPRILPDRFQEISNPSDQTVRHTVLKRASEGDFMGLRDYRVGDDFRLIHWKSSAKCSNLMVREFQTDEADHVVLVLDRVLPHDTTGNPQDIFETAVSIAATMILELDREGFQTRLLTQGNATPFGRGSRHIHRILQILAVVQPDALSAIESWMLTAPGQSYRGSVFLISARRDHVPGIPEHFTRIHVADFHRSSSQWS